MLQFVEHIPKPARPIMALIPVRQWESGYEAWSYHLRERPGDALATVRRFVPWACGDDAG